MGACLSSVVVSLLLIPFQDPPKDDASQVHVKMYKKVAPSVVYVQGPNSKAGSGVIVSKDGYILTSTSACGATDTVGVLLPGQKRVEAKIVGRVVDKELVVLKIEATDLTVIEYGDSEKVKAGQTAYTFGDCYNSIAVDDQVSMSVGVISAVYEITKKHGNFSKYTGVVLETSAAVNPHLNGGPMIDASGKLLGLICLNYHESKFAGIAIPIHVLKPEIERILAEAGGVPAKDPVWTGFEIEEVDELAGVRVTKVTKNSPAAKAGLLEGDVILRIDGARTLTERRFQEVLSKKAVGSALALKVERDGKEVDLSVTLDKRPVY